MALESVTEFGSEHEFATSILSISTDTPLPYPSAEKTKIISTVPELRGQRPGSVAYNQLKRKKACTVVPVWPQVGTTILDFELISILGQGGFARVYLAKQQSIGNRTVVLKVSTRRTAEAEHLGKLHHSNIVPIYSVHEAPPFQLACMPYMGKITLADLLKVYRHTGTYPSVHRRSTFSQESSFAEHLPHLPYHEPDIALYSITQDQIQDVLRLLLNITQGLKHAHSKKILHLDIKPANILLSEDDQPLLLDFNLSLDRTSAPRPRAGGTVSYMAPEQLEAYARQRGDETLDERCDLYALGVVAFELLSGRHPCQAEDMMPKIEDYLAIKQQAPPKLPNPEGIIPSSVVSIVDKLLQPEPENRYQSAAELEEDLQRELTNRPIKYAKRETVLELSSKFYRRNRQTVLGSLIVSILVVFTSVGWLVWYQGQRQLVESARLKAEHLESNLTALQVKCLPDNDSQTLQQAIEEINDQLMLFGWSPECPSDSLKLDGLNPAQQLKVKQQLAELALLASQVTVWPYLNQHDEVGTKHRNIALSYLQAAKAWDPHRLDKAIYITEKVIHNNSGVFILHFPSIQELNYEELYYLALINFRLHRYQETKRFIAELCKHKVNHGPAQLVHGIVSTKLRDTYSSYLGFSYARQIIPNNALVELAYATYLMDSKETKWAITECDKLIKIDPDFTAAYLLRGRCHAMLGQHDAALNDYSICIDRAYQKSLVYLLKSISEKYLNQQDESLIDQLNSDRELMISDVQYIELKQLAKIYDSIDLSKAYDLYSKLVVKRPLDSDNWLDLGSTAYLINKDILAVLHIWDKAIHYQPFDPELRLSRAVVYAQLKRSEQAHEDVRLAMQGVTNDPSKFYLAARVYAYTTLWNPGDAEIAVSYLKQSLKYGFRDKTRLMNDPYFRTIRQHEGFKKLIAEIQTIYP